MLRFPAQAWTGHWHFESHFCRPGQGLAHARSTAPAQFNAFDGEFEATVDWHIEVLEGELPRRASNLVREWAMMYRAEPHYCLFVRFKDGVAGRKRSRPEELTGALAPLRDEQFFSGVDVDHRVRDNPDKKISN